MTSNEIVNKAIDIHNKTHNTNFHLIGTEREKFRSILTILLERLFQDGHLKHHLNDGYELTN